VQRFKFDYSYYFYKNKTKKIEKPVGEEHILCNGKPLSEKSVFHLPKLSDAIADDWLNLNANFDIGCIKHGMSQNYP